MSRDWSMLYAVRYSYIDGALIGQNRSTHQTSTKASLVPRVMAQLYRTLTTVRLYSKITIKEHLQQHETIAWSILFPKISKFSELDLGRMFFITVRTV